MGRKLPPGIRKKGRAYQAYIQVHTRLHTKAFPLGTSIDTMLTWRASIRAAFGGRQRSTARGTFAADAERYLKAKSSMPTFKERQKHVEEWIAVFGNRPRDLIEPADIQTHREALIAAGYSAQSVNLRLRALSNLWTVLDGRRAYNPVREVPEVDPPDAEPRSLPWTVAQQVIDALPNVGQGLKGKTRVDDPHSKTKARLRVMVWTGIPPATLKRLTSDHVDWHRPAVLIPRRKKGKGSRGMVKPLSYEGLRAFQYFDTIHAWGTFSTSSVYKSFKRAIRAVVRAMLADGPPSPTERALIRALERARPYDLRHTYAAALFRASGGNLAVVGDALHHSDGRLTQRYAREALDEALVAAEARLAELVQGESLPAKSAR